MASARNRDMAARTRARVAGICYLITVAGSIPALALERPVLSRAGFVLSNSADTRLVLGGVLDLLTAVACVGTAVALYPLLRQRHPGLALGFVTSRVIEAATIVISVVAILSLVTLHEAAAGATGAERASLLVSGKLLVALHSWTFLLGPGLMPAINALLLGTVMFRTGLVPRIIAVIGLVGAPLLIASATATILGVYGQVSAPAGLAALPVAAWELSLGLWLTIKGLQAKAVPGLASRR
ncbi:MAG TPA: DUF4386 domain-containing protein [Streptosporangiaceae bacterium]|nr:DUF4386 domain-containing protein [Streptosporangiaceae bacterium]